MPAARAQTVRTLAVIVGPALVAGALCAYQLSARSLWVDEGATVAIAGAHGHALWAGIAHDGGNMALYYLLEHLLISWFGAAPELLRAPSALAVVACAGLTALLALRLALGRPAALVAGLLVAVSLPLIYWGQNARGYALMSALALCSFIALSVLITGGGPRAVALYVLSTLAALYVGFDVALLIPAQALAVAWFAPRRWPSFGTGLALIAVGAAGLAVLALRRGSGQLFWVQPLNLGGANAGLQALTGAVQSSLRSSLSPATEIAGTLLAVLALVTLLARRRAVGAPASQATIAATAQPDGDASWSQRTTAGLPVFRPADGGGWFAVIWLWPTAILIVALSALHEPVELDRVAVLLIAPLALSTAWLLVLVARSRRLRWLGWLTAAILLALRAAPVLAAYGVTGEPWSAVTRTLVAGSARTPACVAFFPQDGRMVFDYYLERGRGSAYASARAGRLRPVWPALAWSSDRAYVERYALPSAAQRRAMIAGCPVLWLLSSHVGDPHGTPLARAHVRDYGRLVAELRAAYPHAVVRGYGQPAELHVWRFSR